MIKEVDVIGLMSSDSEDSGVPHKNTRSANDEYGRSPKKPKFDNSARRVSSESNSNGNKSNSNGNNAELGEKRKKTSSTAAPTVMTSKSASKTNVKSVALGKTTANKSAALGKTTVKSHPKNSTAVLTDWLKSTNKMKANGPTSAKNTKNKSATFPTMSEKKSVKPAVAPKKTKPTSGK
eukprot:scaffold1186_cov35-Cyclotella_meneghiniana.AAC.2